MCLVLVQCLCGCVSVHEVPLVFLGSYFGFRREAGFVLVKVCGFCQELPFSSWSGVDSVSLVWTFPHCLA